MEEAGVKLVEAVESLFDYCEQIVVGVSGGADSMTLLHCLKSSNKNFQLVVMHVNHCLRGDESDSDEDFVRVWCEKNNVRFLSKRVEVLKISETEKQSIETVGRNERYRFFNTVGGRIATAHTLSDRVETFLMNILRGSGLKGLISIPIRRGRILRPLLNFTRAEIEKYCEENGVSYRTDSSNFSFEYFRNKVRHNVVSKFLEIDSNFEKKVLRTIGCLEQDEKYISDVANEKFEEVSTKDGLNLRKLNELRYSIKIRIVNRFLGKFNFSVTSEMLIRIVELCKLSKGRQSLPGGNFAVVENGVLKIEKRTNFVWFDCILPDDFKVFHKNFCFIRCKIEQCSQILNNFEHMFVFKLDCDKIVGDIHFRSRIFGDKVKLLNRPRKSLKDLMWEKKIPAKFRNDVVVLADDLGPFWVEGFGLDVRVLPEERSKNLLLAFKGDNVSLM